MGARVADDHELWERIGSHDANAFEAFYRDSAPSCGRWWEAHKPLRTWCRRRSRKFGSRRTASGRS